MRWAVLTTNQASGQVNGLDVSVYRHLDDAVEEAERRANETASVGRRERHYVAELAPAHDWLEVASAMRTIGPA